MSVNLAFGFVYSTFVTENPQLLFSKTILQRKIKRLRHRV